MGDAGVGAVLITERLYRRQLRSPDRLGESRAFAALGRHMSRDTRVVPQKAVNAALDLCDAGSAGISILRQQPKGDYLHWNVVAGRFAAHTDVVTPRDFSPCGTALETNAAQLFHCPGRFFTYLNGLGNMVVELLVVPIQADDHALGTMWVASHDPDERQFDAGDLRIMVGLADFAAVALQKNKSPSIPDAGAKLLGGSPEQPPLKRWPLPSASTSVARWARRLVTSLGID